MIFVNHNLCPLSELIYLQFSLKLYFVQFLYVFLQLRFFIDKFKSLVFILIYLFNCGLGIVINVLIVLSFYNYLIFYFIKNKYVFNRAYFSYHLHITYLIFMSFSPGYRFIHYTADIFHIQNLNSDTLFQSSQFIFIQFKIQLSFPLSFKQLVHYL